MIEMAFKLKTNKVRTYRASTRATQPFEVIRRSLEQMMNFIFCLHKKKRRKFMRKKSKKNDFSQILMTSF